MASARDHHHQLSTPYGATAAPPPTPSTQPNINHISTSSTIDTLSLLLHRLPPSLSLPTRRPSPRVTTPPLISLSSPSNPNLLSASQLGFFQLTDHSIPSKLALSAESESISLFNLPREEKTIRFPKNWPLGFDDGEDDGDETGAGGSFCIDPADSSELGLGSLREFGREMERVGLEVVEALSGALGFLNPVREDPTRVCSLMWISQGSTGNEPVLSGKLYPFVVGLEYQIRGEKCSLLADSGWISVSPQVDSVLVTLGDIAQVWSNGKLKKVRGRAMPCLEDRDHHVNNNSNCNNNNNNNICMTLLLTLPLRSSVSPLPPAMVAATKEAEDDDDDDDGGGEEKEDEERVGLKYKSFSFEDYAWRVYHDQRLILKDPLDRYLQV